MLIFTIVLQIKRMSEKKIVFMVIKQCFAKYKLNY